MKDHHIAACKKHGVDPDEMRIMINLIYILADMQENLTHMIEVPLKRIGSFRYGDKVSILEIRRLAKELRVFADNTNCGERLERYGKESDQLLNHLMEYIKENKLIL